ncbi:MAG: hypothetical protein LBC37_08000 [Zoogloeaceae bacterium]|nr:hypothetical protein [Zoogloeaceae bacterium]
MSEKYGSRIFCFLALATLSYASLAQIRSEELTEESFKASIIEIKDGIPIESQFPRLNLVRISKKIPVSGHETLGCCESSYGYCYSNTWCSPHRYWNREGFLAYGHGTEYGKTAIQKTPYMDYAYNWSPNPDGTKWLGEYRGDANYAVASADTGVATILPNIDGREDISVIDWRWKTKDTLIGVVYEYSPEMLKPNRYPEKDLRPEKVFLFFYDLNDAGNKLYLLNLPKIRRGMVIRLDGVTPKGALVLTEVEISEDYYEVGSPERVLGVFDLAPPKNKAK